MNFKKTLMLFSFLIIFSSILFAQSKHSKTNLRGWEKKQHLEKDSPKTISQNELKNIGNNLNQLIGKSALNKTKKNKTTFLRTLIDKKKPYLVDIKKSNYSNLEIHWSEKRKTPTYISNFNKTQLSKTKNISATEQAVSFIERNKKLFQLENPKNELTVKETLKDKLGSTHVKLTQNYKGIPLWGSEIVVHSDLTGKIYSINAQYSETPTKLNLQNNVNNKQALQIAKNNLQLKTTLAKFSPKTKKLLDYDGAKATKYIWVDNNNQKHLIWHVQIRPNIRDNWYFFIDAITGKILQKYNATNYDGPLTATATDLNGVNRNINVYNSAGTDYMIDASRDMWQTGQTNIINDPKGAVLTIDAHGKDLTNETQIFHITTTTASWNDPVSVSAHYNAGFVYEYYKNTHGRNAIDDKGSTVLSIIHVTDKGTPMDNAYWNGKFMIYGDGNQIFKPLAGALDVSGHEMTHGVIQHTAALEYKFQSGALNESLADVFGSMVDKEDWLLGEDVTKTSYIATGALRNMLDPHNGGNSLNDNGWQPAHMNEFLNLTINQDNGGVHINSGIPNKACALIGNAIGKEKTEKIYYRTLNARYLNSQSQFIDMRLAAVRAATDLYGENSTEVNAVKQAFDNVGILDGNGTKPPEDIPAVNGDEWIAAINAETSDNSLYLLRPVIKTENDLKHLTATQIFTDTGNPISVADNGSVILFIDNNNTIRAIRSNGNDEMVISTDSVWKSIALSPDGTKLAATTYWEDALIYIFDLENSSNSKSIKLYNPTSQEDVKDNVVKYADALDWDLSSQFVVYDSFNKIPKAAGGNIEYWAVNILDVQNEKVYSIFPPQEEGISFGNPSFGQTNDNYLVFDKIDFNNSVDEIWAVNLFSGKGNVIENNGSSIGFPRYSPNDEHLIFQKIDTDGNTELRQIAMANNKISSASGSVNYVTGGQLPTWFAIGTRPVSVEKNGNKITSDFHLYQNYPNPFNPTTTIKYTIPFVKTLHAASPLVQLKVYNLLGKKVVTLINKNQKPGNYRIEFNASNLPSGIYFYKLQSGGFVKTKKMLLLK